MQIQGPGGVIHGIDVRQYGTKGCQALEFPAGLSLVMETPEDCDEVIKAAVAAKNAMIAARQPAHEHEDAALPWTTAHEFIPCTACSEDACNACGRREADEVHAAVLEGTVVPQPEDAPYAEKLTVPQPPEYMARGAYCGATTPVDTDDQFDMWLCGAQPGHAGPEHVAYSGAGRELHRWPVAVTTPAASQS